MENRLKFRFWNGEKWLYYDLFSIPKDISYIGKPYQCTGLPDKNKIMDYEGNLLKDEFSTIYETVWNNKNSCFDFEIVKFGIEPKFYRDSYCADNLANMEIIGNKFEHSHLLKGGE